MITLEELGIPRAGWVGRRRAIAVMVLQVAGMTAFFLGLLFAVTALIWLLA